MVQNFTQNQSRYLFLQIVLWVRAFGLFPPLQFLVNWSWRQLRCIMKSSLQNEQWLQTKIHQLFVSEWKNAYFSHARWNTNDSFTFKAVIWWSHRFKNEHWLQTMIHQLFVSEWKNEYFSHARWNTNDSFTF